MKKEKKDRSIEIKNKKAEFEYFLNQRFEAGIALFGTEIKSIKEGKANLVDAFCFFRKSELFVKNMHIGTFDKGSYNNHEPLRVRKLLLNKIELKKLHNKVKEKGNTIIPVKLYINDRGFAKLEIALASGKKKYDKRKSIKEKDIKREIARNLK